MFLFHVSKFKEKPSCFKYDLNYGFIILLPLMVWYELFHITPKARLVFLGSCIVSYYTKKTDIGKVSKRLTLALQNNQKCLSQFLFLIWEGEGGRKKNTIV